MAYVIRGLPAQPFQPLFGLDDAALDAVLPAIRESKEARRVRWSLDVDPVDLY